MKKIKFTKANLLLATLVAATLVPVGTFAADGDTQSGEVSSEKVEGSTSETDTEGVVTKANLEIIPGNLTVSGFNSYTFPSIKVADVYSNDYEKSVTPQIDVENFLGNLDSEWSLMVNSTGWRGDDAEASTTMNKLLVLKLGDENISQSGDYVAFKNLDSKPGNNSYDLDALKLTIQKNSNVIKGTYVNTLTWTIGTTTPKVIK